jgi:hypothetical protein
LAFFAQNPASFGKIWIITLAFKKSVNFFSPKIAEKCDHNIDPWIGYMYPKDWHQRPTVFEADAKPLSNQECPTFLVQHTKTRNKYTNYTNWPQIIPNGHKVYQMVTNVPNHHKILQIIKEISQHFPLEGPANFTQIGILGSKIYHLATLFFDLPCRLLTTWVVLLMS